MGVAIGIRFVFSMLAFQKGDFLYMKATTKRTLKKLFLNVTAGLAALVFTGNVIAGENMAELNKALGTVSSKIVTELPAGVQDEGFVRYYQSKFNSVAELKEAGNAKVREVEGEGIVLMKNDNNVLPLAAGAKVSLVGITSLNPVYGGTGSGAVDADGAPNYVDVLKGAGFNLVDEALMEYYVDQEAKRDSHGINEIAWKKVKKNNDGMGQGEDVIFVFGRVGGEGNDVGYGIEDTFEEAGDYLRLNEDELSILEGLGKMKEDGDIRSITVVVNSANPISMNFADNADYGIDAVLWVGSVGQTGLYALGDVLTGAVNPSGSLPDTWWQDNQQDPVQNNFDAYVYADADKFTYPDNPNSFNRYVVYQEGVYLGYKYAETRYEDVVLGTPNAGNFPYSSVVAYPFGYGLSYTQFAMGDMKVEKGGEGLETAYNVTVTVTNNGTVAGKKAVQVYAQKPYTEYDKANQIEKPAVEFVGFGKTKLLAPGESETVTVSVPEYFLTSYDAFNTGVYILEDGTHYLTVADNAHAAANNILSAKGKTTADGMTAEGNVALTYAIEYGFDASTYAKAYGTGEDVKSLFAAADINRYEGSGSNTVSYYSRSNWEGTVTAGPVKLAMNNKLFADTVLTDEDLPSAAGFEWPTMGKDAGLQLINMKGVAYDDEKWETFMDQLTYEQMAVLCVNGLRMTYGIEEIGKPQTVDHNGPSGVTQKYSIGHEGYAYQTNDPNMDMKGTCYPCNGIVAATMNTKLVEEVGELIGEDAMWAGYAGLYGTGLNIHRSPYAGRVFEYYSEDGILTGLIDAVETTGIQSKGVYVYNKHFVLNDQENNRAGIGTWCNEQALREIYLRAFELPIKYANAQCVMTAYNRLGAIWAGAYTELQTNWLRGEAGMTGFAVTDMYDGSYMVKVNEIVAGNDIPDNDVGKNISEIADYGPKGSKANPMVGQAVRTSAKRVLQTVANSRGMDGISQYTRVVSVTPWWQMALNIAQWTLSGLAVIALLLLLLDFKGKKA